MIHTPENITAVARLNGPLYAICGRGVLSWLMRRRNYGIFYHCFFLAFWPVSGRCICFHLFPVCRVSTDWRQAFFPLLVSRYAILNDKALGTAWGFSVMLLSGSQWPYEGFSCLALCPTIALRFRPLCVILRLYKGNQF